MLISQFIGCMQNAGNCLLVRCRGKFENLLFQKRNLLLCPMFYCFPTTVDALQWVDASEKRWTLSRLASYENFWKGCAPKMGRRRKGDWSRRLLRHLVQLYSNWKLHAYLLSTVIKNRISIQKMINRCIQRGSQISKFNKKLRVSVWLVWVTQNAVRVCFWVIWQHVSVRSNFWLHS